MTTNWTMTAIRPLPAGDYCEPEHAVRTDAGILVITGIRGKIIDWHVLATVDPDSDAVLSLALHALDHGQPNEPYRTNATIDGAAYIYDPEAKSGFTASDPVRVTGDVELTASMIDVGSVTWELVRFED